MVMLEELCPMSVEGSCAAGAKAVESYSTLVIERQPEEEHLIRVI